MVRKASETSHPRSQPTLQPRLSFAQRELVGHLLIAPVGFMDDPAFHRPNAHQRIFEDAPRIEPPRTGWYQPLLDERRPAEGAGALPKPPRTAVLTAAQERVIFSQFNYARYRLAKLQRASRRESLTAACEHEMLRWHSTAHTLRCQIAESNLALVLAMAKRVRAADLDFGDLMSEGNMALMRSIDKFDVTRGFKFSTYACRAILKAYSRLGMKTLKYRQHFPVAFDQDLERGDHVAEVRAKGEQDSIREVKELFEDNRVALTEIERTVLFHRFGLDRPVHESTMTLEQVGLLIGVTKERVRQIQTKALEKLRVAIVAVDRAPRARPRAIPRAASLSTPRGLAGHPN